MLTELYRYLKTSDTLHSSGMPTRAQISALAQEGIQVVINLSTSTSEGWMPDEQAQVEAQNITYYEIPVEWESPANDSLKKFLTVIDKHQREKILVHCQENYRAAAFIALYRFNLLGWSEANAFKDLQKIWNPAEYPIWKKFIETSLRAQS